ncbi:MAG: fasciclin domain-containing protein [Hellea sp.]
MKNLKNRASRGAISFTLITAGLAFAASASAGDCAMKKAQKTTQTTTQATAQYTITPAMQVLSSTAQSHIVYANHHKTKTGTIVDAAIATDSLSTLVAAVTAADLADTLSSPGPFTVFAPLNDAFAALPEGTVEGLLQPKNKAALQGILKGHVISGNLSAADIIGLAEKNGGTVDVQTVSGDTLTAVLAGGSLYVKDESGGLASVRKADIMQSNGVVHVVDRVLLPSG